MIIHTAMNAILKANNLGVLENLAAWFFLKIEFINKSSLYFLIAQRVQIYLKDLLQII